MKESLLYLIIAIYSLISNAHLVYYLITELTEILNINVFTLTDRQLAAQKATKRD